MGNSLPEIIPVAGQPRRSPHWSITMSSHANLHFAVSRFHYPFDFGHEPVLRTPARLGGCPKDASFETVGDFARQG